MGAAREQWERVVPTPSYRGRKGPGVEGQKRLRSVGDDLPASEIMQVSIRQVREKSASGGTQHGRGLEAGASWQRLLAQTTSVLPVRKSRPGCGGAGSRRGRGAIHDVWQVKECRLLSGRGGTREGFYAGSFKDAFEEKKNIHKLFIKPDKMVQ